MRSFVDLDLANMHYYINTQTMQFHTEQDQSYTIMTVQQHRNLQLNKGKGAKFKFPINSNSTIFIHIVPKICFMYSGYLLTYQQKLADQRNLIQKDYLII